MRQWMVKLKEYPCILPFQQGHPVQELKRVSEAGRATNAHPAASRVGFTRNHCI